MIRAQRERLNMMANEGWHVTRTRQSKHLMVYAEHPVHGHRRFAIPNSPSDKRGLVQFRADLLNPTRFVGVGA